MVLYVCVHLSACLLDSVDLGIVDDSCFTKLEGKTDIISTVNS